MSNLAVSYRLWCGVPRSRHTTAAGATVRQPGLRTVVDEVVWRGAWLRAVGFGVGESVDGGEDLWDGSAFEQVVVGAGLDHRVDGLAGVVR